MKVSVIAMTLVGLLIGVGTGRVNASGYTFTDLGALGGSYSEANGINDFGQVVGNSYTFGNSAVHATIWNGTTPTDLGTLGGSSFGYGINNSGAVVGISYTFNYSAYHATIWNGTTLTDLGTLGGGYNYAYGINDSGQVVGQMNGLATIWNGTTPTDLGTIGGSSSMALGINDSGQVVGTSYTFGDSTQHATIWNGTTPTDLNDFLSVSEVNEGWVLDKANGINDNGWIVGSAHNTITGFGNTQGFLLTPVPEPETYAMFMAGLGLMGFIARRRKNSQA